jgi:hypothetical protein
MVDNVTADPGTAGAVFATDDIGGVHYPIGKIAFGALDSQTLASSGSGATDAGTQRVVLSTDSAGVQPNFVSTNNSTTSTLAGDAVYTGTGEDVSAYTSITFTADSSHDSATNGMTAQFSTDNSNWDDTYSFTYTAANGARRFQFPVTAQYFRIVYTNGSTIQTHFRLQTILHRNNVLTSIHRLADDMNPDRSAQVVKSVLYAQAAGSGDFTAVDATAGGNLKTSISEISDGLDIGAGNAGTETARVSIATDDVNLAAINAGQLPDGHNVTVDNATGASAVNIQDGGNSITVDGTVTETNSTAILADTANMDTNLGTVAGAVAAGQMQVDIVADGAGLATAANQLADGHNVTVDNGAAGAAVNIQDGGNSITVDGTVTANPASGTIDTVTTVGTVTTVTNDVNIADGGNSITVDNGGTFAVQSTLQAGSALAGDVGISGARTSGGTTLYKNLDVDESEDEIKGTAGQLYWVHAVNLTATILYLKFYNATAASVTVGTTTPDLTFPVPSAGDTNGAGFNIAIPNGIAFGTALTVAATTGFADNDSGAPAANALILNAGYA